MALSPDKVYELGQPDKAEIDRITALIDSKLIEAVRTGRDSFSGCITVDTRFFGEDYLIRKAVIDAYGYAGWQVTVHPAGQNGDWVEFRRPSTPSGDFRDACGSYQER